MTGLNIKQGVNAKIGGLNIQPIKNAAQYVVDPTILKPTPLKLVGTVKGPTNYFDVIDKLKLSSVKPKRAKIIAEKGIAIFRPEIVLATKFVPAYNGESGGYLTPAGELIELQIASRAYRLDNINNFIDSLAEDEAIAAAFEQLAGEYKIQMGWAMGDVRYMTDAYLNIDRVNRALDIQRNLTKIKQRASQIIGRDRPVFGLRELFVDHLGFSNRGFVDFTNTKLIGQLIFDTITACRKYTPGMFGIIDQDRPDDVDPLRYDRTATLTNGKFTFDIADFGRSDATVNAFKANVFNRFVSTLPDAKIDKFKLLSVTMSRVLCISSALGRSITQTNYSRLGLNVNVEDPIDVLAGELGETIVDVVGNERGLLRLLQIDNQTGDIALPFEKRFVYDTSGRRYIPGEDYFFDGLTSNDNTFDLARVEEFNSSFKHGIAYTTDIIDVAVRTDTPAATRVIGSASSMLWGETIYARALDVTNSIIKNIGTGKTQASRDMMFVVAAFRLAQNDKKLRHLLFQLMAVASIWNQHTVPDQKVDDLLELITSNEIKTYGDFPALFGASAKEIVQGEEHITEIGSVSVKAPKIAHTAYTELQRITIKRIVGLLTKGGKILNNILPPKFTVTNLGLAQKLTTVNYPIPEKDTTYDNAFYNVFTLISQFAGMLEAAAADFKSTPKHLLIDKSGRSRYLNVSTSMRMLLSFELIASMLSGFDIVRFGNVDDGNKTVQLSYDKNRLTAFNAATITHTSTKTSSTPAKSKQADSKNVKSLNYASSVELYTQEFDQIHLSVKKALVEDRQVIGSMTTILRTIALQIDDATQYASSFFSDIKNNPSTRYTHLQSKPKRKSNRIDNRDELANLHERQARNAMLSRQQTALSCVQLANIADFNNIFSPERFMITKSRLKAGQGTLHSNNQPRHPYVDESAVQQPVQNALWSYLSRPELRGPDGSMTQVLTVGIPAGFTEKLEESLVIIEGDIAGLDADRHTDIVNVNVYYKNVIEDDIIFKPISYVFELSRFVSGFSFIDTPNRESTSPTAFKRYVEDLTRTIDFSNFDVSLAAQQQTGNEFVHDLRYSFMTPADRKACIHNHVASYLLGVYIRMMTSIDVKEDAFFIEPDAIKNQLADKSTKIYKLVGDILAQKSGANITLDNLRLQYSAFDQMLTKIEDGEYSPGILEQQLTYDKFSSTDQSFLAQDATELAKLFGTKSMLSGGERQRRSITSPKLFERTFNVPVDPFAFEIDWAETQASDVGTTAARRLIAQQKIYNIHNAVSNTRKYYMTRSVLNSDIDMSQYFVTISRYEQALKPKTVKIPKILAGIIKKKS